MRSTFVWISQRWPLSDAIKILNANSGKEAANIAIGNTNGTVLMQIEFDKFNCKGPFKIPLGDFQESTFQFSFASHQGVKGCTSGCNLQFFAFTDNLLGDIGLLSVTRSLTRMRRSWWRFFSG